MTEPNFIFTKTTSGLLHSKQYAYPLHRHVNNYLQISHAYMRVFNKLDKKDPIHIQLKSYKLLSEIRLIFESNRIENAGVSLTETRKLINEYFPEIPCTYDEFKTLDTSEIEDLLIGRKFRPFVESLKSKDLDCTRVHPTIQFGKQSRNFIEVAQHYVGYLYLEAERARFRYLVYAYQFAEHVKHNYSKKKEDNWKAQFDDLDFDTIKFPTIFTENFIKSIHKHIAKNLMPEDSMVDAGKYRIDDRAAGIDTVFVSPKLIPNAMKHFVINANILLDRALNPITSEQHISPISAAAQISHQLVRIHPFPDFNGRLSRLFSAFVLRLANVPFAVTVRGGGRDKQRYITALKHADRGNYSYYEAILCKSMIDCFFEIDSNLSASHIATLTDRVITDLQSRGISNT